MSQIKGGFPLAALEGFSCCDPSQMVFMGSATMVLAFNDGLVFKDLEPVEVLTDVLFGNRDLLDNR